MQYTKGDWEIKQLGGLGSSSIFAGDKCVADIIYDQEYEPSLEEIEANANLIAASPMNYERLKATTTILENIIKDYPYIAVTEVLRQIVMENHRALAKAEGGKQ